jgi:hypothetical protein
MMPLRLELIEESFENQTISVGLAVGNQTVSLSQDGHFESFCVSCKLGDARWQ